MFGRRWWLVLGILLLIGLALRSDAVFLLVALLALSAATSLLWSRYCLTAVTYRRRLSDDRIFYGEEAQLTIEVTNAKPLPLAWLLLRDAFPRNIALLTGELEAGQEPGQEQPEKAVSHLTDVLALRWYERVRRTYRIRGDNRGLYLFGPVSLSSGDLFGFHRKSETHSTQDALRVYPRIVPVTRLGLPAERPAGEEKAKRRIIEDPLRVATVREYVPGDSIRHIHWKNTARLDRLQTKVFDPGARRVTVLFVDLQTVTNPYGIVPEYLELAITAAGSVAVHGLDERYAVGVYATGGPRNANYWTIVPPGRSSAQATRILDALAPLFGFRLVPMHQLLRRSMPALPFGSTVVVITACVTEDLLVSLLSLQDVGHPVVLLTVGDEEPEVPEAFERYHLGGRDAWHRLETLELD
jgi:uncharacterized protein (DUF58 family)